MHKNPLSFIPFISDPLSNFRYVRILLQADDLKLFMVVEFLSDSRTIQFHLEMLPASYSNNKSRRNISECYLTHAYNAFRYLHSINSIHYICNIALVKKSL